jgi:PhnB protein
LALAHFPREGKMKKLVPYLHFVGQCRAALETYKQIFNGEISSLQTYGDSNREADASNKDAVLHSVFDAEGIHFMASDDMRGFQVHPDNNVTLSLDFSDEQEQARVFNALAEGGSVTMPLEKTFWGAKFGMLTDRYGIQWMLNCEMPPIAASTS